MTVKDFAPLGESALAMSRSRTPISSARIVVLNYRRGKLRLVAEIGCVEGAAETAKSRSGAIRQKRMRLPSEVT